MKGFRGLLTILSTYIAIYIDAVTTNLSGISMDQLKISAMIAAPIAVKLIWTDARPKIVNWIADKLAK